MKLKYPPYLISLFYVVVIVVNLFGNLNLGKVPALEMFPPLLLLAGIVFLVYLFWRALLKDNPRVELLTFLTVIFLTSYGFVFETVETVIPGERDHVVLLTLWMGLAVLGIYLLLSREEIPQQVFMFARNAVTVLLALAVVWLAFSFITQPRTGRLSNIDPMEGELTLSVINTPDIYYIILDEYVREDILLDLYGYDNSSFIEGLEARGFTVIDEAQSNYLLTFLSLASSLNMQYLEAYAADSDPGATQPLGLYRMIRNSIVQQALREAGYTTINLSSGWGATSYNFHADSNYVYPGLSPHMFTSIVLRATLFSAVSDAYTYNSEFHRWEANFAYLEQVPDRPEPTFTLAHFVLPHGPYVYSADCSKPSADVVRQRANTTIKDVAGYLEQATCTNQRVLEMIDELLAESEQPPVIIIQGDHGTIHSGDLLPGRVTSDVLVERPAILSAYHIPGVEEELLHENLTPVNTFRIVFNTYFGTGLEMLPDVTYFSTYTTPFDLQPLEQIEPDA